MGQDDTNELESFEARHTIASVLAPVDVPPDQVGPVRASQLDSIDRLGMILVITNLLNAAVVLVLFSAAAKTGLLGLWGSVLCMGCAFLFLRAIEGQNKPKRMVRSNGATLKYTLTSLFFGMLWAALPMLVLPSGDMFSQMAVGIILCGMIFGAALIMFRLPKAAFAFVFPVAASLVVGFSIHSDMRSDFLAVLALVYTMIVTVCVRWNYNQFLLQHLNKAAVAQQNSLIGLLLRDFEESTSDWLWQTNSRGVILDIPLNVRGVKSGYDVMKNGVPLLDLFQPSQARNVLEASLKRQSGFRDLVLEVADASGEPRWWSLTGKPLVEDGILMGFRGVASDVTQSKQIEDRIAHMAHYDGLTGLPNRAHFQERFERYWSGPVDSKLVSAVVLLDLDNFKWVNDTLGHAAGDEVLRQLSSRLSGFTSTRDTIARLGGDEFALILERDTKRALQEQLDVLVSELCRPYDVWGSTANCGASLGVRLFRPGLRDPETLLSHADLALYQAKSKGKGNWCVFTPKLDEHAQARRLIERDLQDALVRDELYLEFQPIQSSETGAIVACETLLRWQHPEKGLILPGEFIEHAEDCGLITRMGDWIIRQALAEARQLPDSVRISVNISPLQLHSANLIPTIVNALATNRIDPARLDLEITESVLLADTDFVLQRLVQLRKLGLSLSLDDFGTGFSSLSYLRTFPFDKIKLDKSFISDLETNEDNRAIAKATLSLAKSLGLRSTAEGVETEAQKVFLTKLGCDELQGYHISRAKPLSELTHLIGLNETKAQEEAPASLGTFPELRPEAVPVRAVRQVGE
ncbi:MAG: EAL domain-containing protein [Pseudomonadota bacterium]